MNEYVAMFLDAGVEWWPTASSALAAILAGAVLFILKRHLALRDKAQELQRIADHEERKRVAEAIAGLGLQLGTEQDERRNAIAKEGDIRRDKDDAIGRDLVNGLRRIENAFSYYCGKMDEKRPKFDD